MRKSVGVVLAVAGAALGLLLRNKLHPRAPEERDVVLAAKQGRCGISRVPAPVRLRWLSSDRIHWLVSNPAASGDPCDREVVVCLANWKWQGIPIAPPVTAVEETTDDVQSARHAGGAGQFCRRIRPGQRPLRIPAQVSKAALPGTYSYDVLVDGDVALDPMVEIILY